MEIPSDRLVVNQQYLFRYEPPLPQNSPLLSEGLGTLVGILKTINNVVNSYAFKNVTPINRQNEIPISSVFPPTYGQSILHFYRYPSRINTFEGAGTRRNTRLKRRKSRRSKKTRHYRRSIRRKRSMRGG